MTLWTCRSLSVIHKGAYNDLTSPSLYTEIKCVSVDHIIVALCLLSPLGERVPQARTNLAFNGHILLIYSSSSKLFSLGWCMITPVQMHGDICCGS